MADGLGDDVDGRANSTVRPRTLRIAIAVVLVLVALLGAAGLWLQSRDEGLSCGQLENLADLALITPPNGAVDPKLFDFDAERAGLIEDARQTMDKALVFAQKHGGDIEAIRRSWAEWSEGMRLSLLIDAGC